MTKTLEEMLKAVVEASVKGNCFLFIDSVNPDKHQKELRITGSHASVEGYNESHILEILLDPTVLKTVYGEEPVFSIKSGDWKKDIFMNYTAAYLARKGNLPSHWNIVAVQILLAWLSSPEGNVRAAVECAYSLLPKAS